MTVRATEQFSGTDAAAWPAQWTTGVGSTSVVDLLSNAGRMVAQGANFTYARALMPSPSLTNCELRGTFTLTDVGEQYPTIYLRHDGSWQGGSPGAPVNAYYLYINVVDGDLELGKIVASAGTLLAEDAAFTTWTTGQYSFAFRCEGTTISAKVWLSSTTEPPAWSLSTADASLGMSQVNGAAVTARTITFDDLQLTDLVAAPCDLASFDGHFVGPGTDVMAYLDVRDAFGVSGTVEMQARRSIEPLVMSVSPDGRTIPIRLARAAGATMSAATFRSTVKRWFSIQKNTGARYLVLYGDDGSTFVRTACYVERIEPLNEGVDEYLVVLTMAQQWFEANTPTVSAANPTSVTNAGDTPTPASLALTTSTHKTLRACTVSGAGAGGGLLGFPVRLAAVESGMTAGEVFAYSPGNIPTLSDDYNAYIWCLVNTAGDGNISTAVDLVHANAVDDSNTAGGDLNDGGMKLLDAVTGTDSSNSTWSWNDLTVSLNADRCGSWRPALTGKFQTVGTYEITAEGASLTINCTGGGSGERVADSISCVLGCTGSSVANLSRAYTTTGTARAYFLGRALGQSTWTTIWSITATATVTSSITVTGYTELACGCEYTATPGNANTLVLSGNGTGGIFTCSLANTPTVNVPASSNLDYYDGQVANDTNGDYVKFESFMCQDGTLTIDTKEGTVESSVGFVRSYGKIEFGNPAALFQLEPDANAISETLDAGASFTITHRNAYG